MNLARPLAIILGLAAATAATAEAPLPQAWHANDDMAAFARSMEAAENGDADAQFRIAEAYRLGKGAIVDLLSAEVWYFRAAQQGHIGAAAELGLIYAREHRDEDARRWLRVAAAHENVAAQGALAAILFNTPEGPEDVAEAKTLMARAAVAGSALARTQLARMAPPADAAPAPTRLAAVAPATPKAAVAPPPAASPQPTPRLAAAPTMPQSTLRLAALPKATPRPAPALSASLKPTPVETLAFAALPQPAPAAAPVLLASAPAPLTETARVIPAVAHVTPARRSLPTVWRVQVGAFGSDGAARKAWARLAARVALVRSAAPVFTQTGHLIRLQIGAGSRGEALALYRAVRAAHWSCFLRTAPVHFADADSGQPPRL